MKFDWTQFAIAVGLFLLGYLTFNSPWFKSKPAEAPAVSAPAPAPAQGAAPAAK